MLIKRMKDCYLPVPSQHHLGDAGFDLRSRINITLVDNEQALVSCGFAFHIPNGFVGLIKDRSSIASKRKMYIAAGVIDSTYRGEVFICIRNKSGQYQEISIGNKIAQMVVIPFYPGLCEEVDCLPDTLRGTDGFGSTGNK